MEVPEIEPVTSRLVVRQVSYQLLSENKHSLNSTYNFYALKNLQFRFQEKKCEPELRFWKSEVRIPSKFSLEI